MQAYLRRTAADLVGLFEARPSIRLVKGAYAEPTAIAYTTRKDVDANYLALCVLMLPEVRRKNLRLVVGTHDVDLFARVWGYAQALGVEKSQLENAMLYGIRVDQQLRLAREGFTVRDLIAYGDAWYGWYLRRLAERPANVWFVARQLLP
jgi:proline dehydrogenase